MKKLLFPDPKAQLKAPLNEVARFVHLSTRHRAARFASLILNNFVNSV
jgi:hypothetical protein